MNWLTEHQISERLAAEAHNSRRDGNLAVAVARFDEAARAELRALGHLDSVTAPRTFGITVVSCAALLFKAGRLDEAESLALANLTRDELPDFATQQLQELVQAVGDERRQSANKRAPVPQEPASPASRTLSAEEVWPPPRLVSLTKRLPPTSPELWSSLFVGRIADTARLCNALDSNRAVMLSGPRGVGKTTFVTLALARHAESHQQRDFLLYLHAHQDMGFEHFARELMFKLGLPPPGARLVAQSANDPGGVSQRALATEILAASNALPQSVTVVLDDAHRTSQSLLSGLTELLLMSRHLHKTAALRLVLVGEPLRELAGMPHRQRPELIWEDLRLPELSKSASIQYLEAAQKILAFRLQKSVRDRIAELSLGSPIFLESIVRAALQIRPERSHLQDSMGAKEFREIIRLVTDQALEGPLGAFRQLLKSASPGARVVLRSLLEFSRDRKVTTSDLFAGVRARSRLSTKEFESALAWLVEERVVQVGRFELIELVDHPGVPFLKGLIVEGADLVRDLPLDGDT